MKSFNEKFCNLGAPRKIWTVAAINGQCDSIARVHENILDGFRAGDRLVYTGNYFCAVENADPKRMVDTLLQFRRDIMAKPGVMAEDITYLRGVQEELWTKLTQIQMAQSPTQVIGWITQTYPEMDAMLKTFGTSLLDASRIAREGIMSLTRWSGGLKTRLREHRGAEKFFTSLRRAAFTEQAESHDNNILFVHAGINPRLPLTEQGDQFWWAHRTFDSLSAPYEPFRTVIRGSDPQGSGIQLRDITVSLDGGCGKGGQLVCAQVAPGGQVLDYFQA